MTSSAMYRLTTVDGDEVHITAAAFFADNSDLVGSEIETEIRALGVDDTYRGGGGAAPTWSIKRVS